jgi:peptidoglycan/LPS O-acetylase OafA/YrhL
VIIKYRPDIDGLRTIAILPVLFFHAGVPGLSGGFVGVDVFFVISGYLITSIIAREIGEGRFSIITFYERRIRRILPALIAMMLAVMVATAIFYFPSDFRLVPKTVLSALFFCSNVLFYWDSNYFATSAHTKPMLHTWSLAVEEQFYIVFPILLILLHRYAPRWRTTAIVAIAVVSLALSIVTVRGHPDFAFYMLPTRAWELMAGALLAVGAIPAIRSQAARELVAFGGVVSIAWAVVTFSSETRFPGANALFPVLGAAALIHSAPDTLVGKVLGLRPIVFIGLISYSLYLWHWPVVVFAEYVTDMPLSGWPTVGAIGASFFLAILSWRFVERPFRSRLGIPRPRLFQIAAVASAAICVVAGAVQVSDGWPSRFDPEVLRLQEYAESFSPLRAKCHTSDGKEERKPCVLGADVPPTVAVWGDSHGVELSYALGEEAASHGQSLIQRTYSSCPPVLDVDIPDRRYCRRRNHTVLNYLLKHPEINTIVMVGYWASSDLAQTPGVARGLERAVSALQDGGKRIVLVGAVPPNPFPVPRHLAHLEQRGQLNDAQGISTSELNEKISYLAPTFARFRAAGLPIMEPRNILCAHARCDIYLDKQPLYFDNHHLSVPGAELVATRLEPIFQSRPQ